MRRFAPPIVVLASCLAFCGCAGSRENVRYTPPPKMEAEPGASAEQLRQAYLRHRVSDVDGEYYEVNGTYYDSNAMKDHFRAEGDIASLRILRSAKGPQIASVIIPAVAIPVGTVLGAYVGAFVGIEQSFSNFESGGSGSSGNNPILVGGAVGLAAGTALGVSLYFAMHAKAQTRRLEAGKAHNQFLLERLKLEASPVSGGAAIRGNIDF